jgi:hypothetical protein
VDRFDREIFTSSSSSSSSSSVVTAESAEPNREPISSSTSSASSKERGEEEVEYVPGLFGFTTYPVEQPKKNPSASTLVNQKSTAVKPPLAPCRRDTPARYGIKSSSSLNQHKKDKKKRPSSGSLHTSIRSELHDKKRRRHIVKVASDSGSDHFVMLSGLHSCGSGSESGGFSSPWETLTASA